MIDLGEAEHMVERNIISRVVLRNYKSIRDCDVSLGPITFLVGPNGAGKSNFVDALRFVAQALNTSLEEALNSRFGFAGILYREAPRPSAFSIEVFFSLRGDKEESRYKVEIEAPDPDTYLVKREECRRGDAWFEVSRGNLKTDQAIAPPVPEDKLYLLNASGMPVFEPVYRLLSAMEVYNPVPDDIRNARVERTHKHLDRKASGLGEAVSRLKERMPERLDRVLEYLRRVNRDVQDVKVRKNDFLYVLTSTLNGNEFLSDNMSDGTLRAMAVLVALFQKPLYPLTWVGLEEPEAGLHPAAAAVLFDALIEASHFSQVVVTSHSPDLLDREDIPEDSIRAVVMHEGRTIIGDVDDAGKSALRNQLYTAGELMRMDQLFAEGPAPCRPFQVTLPGLDS